MHESKHYISSPGKIKKATIQARCTREEKERIVALAEASGKSLTEFVIHRCLPETEAEKIQDDKVKADLGDRIIYQEKVNRFVDYVRFRLGWYDPGLEQEIQKMKEGRIYGDAATDGSFRL